MSHQNQNLWRVYRSAKLWAALVVELKMPLKKKNKLCQPSVTQRNSKYQFKVLGMTGTWLDYNIKPPKQY